MKDIASGIIVLVIVAIIVTPWFINLNKFINCDFESDLRCEAIHGAGVIMPPASYVTVFFDDDGDNSE